MVQSFDETCQKRHQYEPGFPGFFVAQKVSDTASSAGGASAERSDVSDFTITKLLDKSSPLLALACAEGRHIDTIAIELCRAGKVNYMA
jgi:type VI secretion system secreted protein Hcp